MSASADPCACSVARRSTRALTQLYDRALEPSGLLSTQYSLLRKLEDGPKSVSELATLLHLDRTTLTRNLRVLETSRLIRLNAGEDRRERLAMLTPKGSKSLDVAVPLWKNAQAAVKRHLGGVKYDEFLRLLDRIAAMET